MIPEHRGYYSARPKKSAEFSLLVDTKSADPSKVKNALCKLVDENQPFLKKFISGWITKDDPTYTYDELLQDARLAFMRAALAYDLNSGVSIRSYSKYYLLQLRRKFFKTYRKSSTELCDPIRLEDVLKEKAIDIHSLSAMRRLELSSLLQNAMKVVLTKVQTEILTAHYIDGRQIKTIARRRGCTERSIRKAIQIALPKLRTYLAKQGIVPGFLELN